MIKRTASNMLKRLSEIAENNEINKRFLAEEKLNPSDIKIMDDGEGQLKLKIVVSAGPLVNVLTTLAHSLRVDNVLTTLAHSLRVERRDYEIDDDDDDENDEYGRMIKICKNFAKKFKAKPFSASGIDLLKHFSFKGTSIIIKFKGDAVAAKREIKNVIEAAVAYWQYELDKKANAKATAPTRKKEASKANYQDQKKRREALEAKYGKGTYDRVKIKQIGGDDGYQYNVIVDGRSIMNGLTRSSAEYERDQVVDDLAKKGKLGRYAK